MPSTIPTQRLNRGCSGRFAFLVILLGAIIVLLLITPWALRMGGRWTPALVWHGYGKTGVAGSSADSMLFLEVNPYPHSGRGSYSGRSDNIRGTAIVCTDRGESIPFRVSGRVDAWLDADGKPMTLRLGPPTTPGLLGPSNDTANQHYSFMLYGEWQGQQLRLSDHGSFAPVLAAIKSGAKYPTSGGKMPVVEHSVIVEYHKKVEFDALCSGKSSSF